MADREAILRYLAFRLKPVELLLQKDLDSFLNEAMAELNSWPETRLKAAEKQFDVIMQTAFLLFGRRAFRKQYRETRRRFPISRALFEAWSVNLHSLDSTQLKRLVKRRDAVLDGFLRLMEDKNFDSAISYGTANPNKVAFRLESIHRLIERALS